MGNLQQTLHDISTFGLEKRQFLQKILNPETFDAEANLPQTPGFLAQTNTWQQVFDLAQKNGTQAFLLETLNRVIWKNALPTKTRLILAELNARENLIASIGLEDLRIACKGLCEAKTCFTILSSNQMWREIYPTSTPCPTHTNQILIRPGDLPRALSILGRLGFRAPNDSSAGTNNHCLYRPHSFQGLVITHGFSRSRFHLSHEEYESNTREIQIPGLEGMERRTCTLSNRFLLLHLLSEAITQKVPINTSQALDLWFSATTAERDIQGDPTQFIDHLKSTRTLSMAWFLLGISKKTSSQMGPHQVMNLVGQNISPFKKKIIDQQIKHFSLLNSNSNSLGARVKQRVEQQWLRR